MKTITYDEFIEFYPYGLDNETKVNQLKSYFEANPNMSALDILRWDNVSIEGKIRVVLCEELISADILHEFACLCAEHALSQMKSPDPRCVDAITAKRKWMKGEISDDELDEARESARGAAWRVATSCAARDTACGVASTAARDAANCVARTAARRVASTAAWRVDRVATWRVACDEERAWQLDTLINLLKEEQTSANSNI